METSKARQIVVDGSMLTMTIADYARVGDWEQVTTTKDVAKSLRPALDISSIGLRQAKPSVDQVLYSYLAIDFNC